MQTSCSSSYSGSDAEEGSWGRGTHGALLECGFSPLLSMQSVRLPMVGFWIDRERRIVSLRYDLAVAAEKIISGVRQGIGPRLHAAVARRSGADPGLTWEFGEVL